MLLKEKNKLKSDFLMCKQMQTQFYGFADIQKVRMSMKRLLTVVNERKRLREEYRRYLENNYIEEKKQEMAGPVQKSEEETSESVIEEKSASGRRFYGKAGKIESEFALLKLEEGSELLNEKDLKMIAQARSRLRETDVLKMYTKNLQELSVQDRRRAAAHI